MRFRPRLQRIGRDHVLADVDARARAADVVASRQAAAVHQHRAAVGKGHENRVALAHVEDRDFQTARD